MLLAVLELEQSQLVGVEPLDTLQHIPKNSKSLLKNSFQFDLSQRYIVPQPKEMIHFTHLQHICRYIKCLDALNY